MAPTSGRGLTAGTRSTAVCDASAGLSPEVSPERRGMKSRRSGALCVAARSRLLGRMFDGMCRWRLRPRALDGRLRAGRAADRPAGCEESGGADDGPGRAGVASGRESRSATCLERGRGDDRPRGLVGRASWCPVGVGDVRRESGAAVFGCDNSPGPREDDRRWCGGAYGQLYGGRLRDPRLGIGACRTDRRRAHRVRLGRTRTHHSLHRGSAAGLHRGL